MSRLAGAPPRGWLRFLYWAVRRRLGRDTEPLAVVAHQRTILKGVIGYELMLERARLVDQRLKVLASVKTASLVGCVF